MIAGACNDDDDDGGVDGLLHTVLFNSSAASLYMCEMVISVDATMRTAFPFYVCLILMTLARFDLMPLG